MSHSQNRRKGVIATFLFHSVLLILLCLLGFVTPLPLPEEAGILVNFGDSPTGIGQREPAAPRRQPAPPVIKEVVAPKPQPKPNVEPVVEESGKQDVLTQDYEESVAVDSGKEKRRKAEENRKREEELARRKAAEAEQKRLAEIERLRQAELERQRQAELEKKRIAEALQRQKEAEEQKRQAINDRAKNAFGNAGKSADGDKSQGVTYGGTNQGTPGGTTDANRYHGLGGSGKNISFSLSGRNAQALPKPGYPGNEEGIVVVEVTVDRNGRVTNAIPGYKGSTTMNAALQNAAKKAALQARFNVDNQAPAIQKGTITYRFVLQ